ncbi:MAG: formylmethanofuran dehydrogenase subunit B [Candidatus Methanogaster sp.]|uniref:Formylmethanofuran dehydrogenase subunit B n=1 Tax=Candidatus Methanogaster sp. TaxID=3386292 RepID=A0AC61KYN9_9EURY|nr:MAG: formylmethanofuran dehydrogenase subunit B [ANME-2 cluster archaeon]
MVCTGCALLCDDIEVGENDCRHACRIGDAHITSTNQIDPVVNRSPVDMDTAIKSAAEILVSAEKLVFVGFGNSVTEAQATGIELAKKVGAEIKTFHTGIFDDILDGRVKTCTLPEVRDYADVIIFLGCDPMNTHPRLLSRYAYYPRGEKRQHGWDEDRTAITIDPRFSHTASICKDVYTIDPHRQIEFMDALMDALLSKVPKTTYDKKRILKLAGTLKKAEFGVVFAGTGASTPPRDAIVRLMDRLNESSDFRLLSLAPGYNLRSIAEQLHRLHNRPGGVGDGVGSGSSGGGRGSSGDGTDLHEADCILCLGFDLMNSLPAHGINGKMIVIDPNETLTSRYADVVIPCAAGGIDAAGSAVRMDGETVEVPLTRESGRLSDVAILKRLLEVV